MPAVDQLLATLLRALQHSYAPEETSRLLSTATTLLLTLSNPLNITLLTSQLLTATAVWSKPGGLDTCVKVFQCFYTASAALEQQHAGFAPPLPERVAVRRIPSREWVTAVVRGADDKSPRWRHLLPIGGVVCGLEAARSSAALGGGGNGHGARRDLLRALVKALNLTLLENGAVEGLPQRSISLIASYTFDYLPAQLFRDINHDILLPLLVRTAFFTDDGFGSGYFLGPVDADIIQSGQSQFTWKADSASFLRLQELSAKPLVHYMGPLSRLVGQSIHHVRDASLVYRTVEDIALFARTLATQWRQNKLSEVEAAEEAIFIDAAALQTTVPLLWKLLKACMFTAVNILKAVMAHMVSDPVLAADNYAPFLAMQTLHTLRHLFFISSRLGPNSFSSHVFVFLTAIDILAQYPADAQLLLSEMQPRELGRMPSHPLDRCTDHFFLNTAEHFAPIVSTHVAETIVVGAAIPYLDPSGNRNLLHIFEAAHSVMLAVLATPQHVELAAALIPFYVGVLFKAYPAVLSARQFRLAFKTLVRISAPPAPLALLWPDLPGILLECVHHRALNPVSPSSDGAAQSDATAPNGPPPQAADRRPPQPESPEPAAAPVPLPSSTPSSSSPPFTLDALIPGRASAATPAEPSEETVLTLTLIDSFPFLPHDLLEEWLPLTASLIHTLDDRHEGDGDYRMESHGEGASHSYPRPYLPYIHNAAPAPATPTIRIVPQTAASAPRLTAAPASRIPATTTPPRPMTPTTKSPPPPEPLTITSRRIRSTAATSPVTASSASSPVRITRVAAAATSAPLAVPPGPDSVPAIIPAVATPPVPRPHDSPPAYSAEACKARFWDVLTNGELDMARAQLCATWWTTRGGREMVLFGPPPPPPPPPPPSPLSSSSQARPRRNWWWQRPVSGGYDHPAIGGRGGHGDGRDGSSLNNDAAGAADTDADGACGTDTIHQVEEEEESEENRDCNDDGDGGADARRRRGACGGLGRVGEGGGRGGADTTTSESNGGIGAAGGAGNGGGGEEEEARGHKARGDSDCPHDGNSSRSGSTAPAAPAPTTTSSQTDRPTTTPVITSSSHTTTSSAAKKNGDDHDDGDHHRLPNRIRSKL